MPTSNQLSRHGREDKRRTDRSRALLFVKIGYLTSLYLFFCIFYLHFFPDFKEDNYTRALQVVLQLSQFILNFRLFTTKEEKEAKWLLLICTFYSVVATLFLKNLVSIEGIVFIILPIFCFFVLLLPENVLPFSILIFYSLEKGLAQWAFFLLFQLASYYGLSFFLEKRPKRSIFPLLLLLLYFWVLGQACYSADFLHEPAQLSALVSGACIIFLCFRKRKKQAFLIAFLIDFFISIGIGIISIASAPGGENISCPIPFVFILCHLLLFFGLFLFQKNIRVERQPLVPLLFGALLFFLPYFPNLEWLEGWIEGLDFLLLLLGFLLFVCGEETKWQEYA